MTKLSYDAQGFIQGIKGLSEKTQLVHEDTRAILQILQDWRRQSLDAHKEQTRLNKKQAAMLSFVIKQRQDTISNKKGLADTRSKPKMGDEHTSKTIYAKREKTPKQPIKNLDGRDVISRNDGNRDSKGRFTAKAEENTFVRKLGNEIGRQLPNHGLVADTGQIDPILDGAKELGRIVSPAARLVGLGGSAISVVKQHRNKRREPLPIAQDRHHRKLLDVLGRIDKNTRTSTLDKLFGCLGGLISGLLGGILGGAGLGGITGVFGKKKQPKSSKNPKNDDTHTTTKTDGGTKHGKNGLGGKLLKGGGRLLGAAGSALGLGLLASQWQELTGEQKSAGLGGITGGFGGAVGGAMLGASVGSVVPVVGTAAGGVIGGVIGGLAGSTAGEYLGRKAYPSMKAFGAQMTEYGLPQRMQSGFLGGLSPLFTATPKLVRMMASGIKGIMDRANTWLDSLPSVGGAGLVDGGSVGGQSIVDLASKEIGVSATANQNRILEYQKTIGFNSQKIEAWCASFVGAMLETAGFKSTRSASAASYDSYGQAFDKNQIIPAGAIGTVKRNGGSGRHVFIIEKDNGDGTVSTIEGNYGNKVVRNVRKKSELISVRLPVGVSGNFIQSNTPALSTGVNTKTAKANTTYDHLILQSARKYGVNPALVKSLINTESSFNPRATSFVGAQGLMQLMPGTARDMGVRNAYDPAQNIDGGTKYLAQMLREFGGDQRKALAAYNAGPGNVRRAIRKAEAAGRPNDWGRYLPRPRETVPHGDKTLQNLAIYGGVGSYTGTPAMTTPVSAARPATSIKAATPKSLPVNKPKAVAPVGPVKTNTSYTDGRNILNVSKNSLTQNITDQRLAHVVTGNIGQWGNGR